MFLSHLIAAFMLPPLNGLALLVVGISIRKRFQSLSRVLIVVSIVLLWVMATPLFGGFLKKSLEGSPVTQRMINEARAIVVLGGGRDINSPEYGEDTVGAATLLRLRYAAKLHRDTGLPILVTGGKPDGGTLSEAEVMRRVLTSEFNVSVRWLEDVSVNTNENASLSAVMLKRDGIQTVLIVTQAWHMPRALASFSNAGIKAISAPTSFTSCKKIDLADLLPADYEASRNALHEYIGLLWYRLRH